MGYRRFEDREGNGWEVVDRSFAEWEFRPVHGNPNPGRRARAPGYEKDPFELSSEELQRLLDSAPRPGGRPRKSPFKD
jgi:hypothetical protein